MRWCGELFTYPWFHALFAFFWKLLNPTARATPLRPTGDLVVCLAEPSRALPFWVLGGELPAACVLPWSWRHPLTWLAHLLPHGGVPPVPAVIASSIEELRAAVPAQARVQLYVPPPQPGQLGKLYPPIAIQRGTRDAQLLQCYEMALQRQHAGGCRSGPD